MRIADIEGHSLIDRLKLAFADTEYPGDEAIPQSARCFEEAWEEFRRLLGRPWADLDMAEIPSLSPVLMWLSPEGLGYYLPAFLAAAIFTPSVAGSLHIIGFLAPPGRRCRDESSIAERVWFRRMIKSLTLQQERVVRECLEHLRINMDGVYSYWRTSQVTPRPHNAVSR